ncbi:hypothetical protein [Alteromonas sp. CYL-A6]|uniref:hypothetical protein n=1 Tax=Alteromonas nitratireducens TaxID=3390813 RepID=UPI0034C2F215
MAFSSHGGLSLWVEDNILFMEVSGGWNLEKAKEFIHELNHTISPLVTPPFGAVAVLHDDWMPTSDALPYLNEATRRAIKAGLVREAYVSSSAISSRVTQSLVLPPDGETYESQEFSTFDEAVEWVKQIPLGGRAANHD